MLLFILLFISILFMGGALFSIVLHFSRKKESVFDSSDGDVFVLQKEERSEVGESKSYNESDEKHGILDIDSGKSGVTKKDMSQYTEKIQAILKQAQNWFSQIISKTQKFITTTLSSMSSLFSKFTQAVRDQIAARNNTSDFESKEIDSELSVQEPSDEDFKSLYEADEEVVNHEDSPQTVQKNLDNSMPKRVSEREMSFFTLDTEDELADDDLGREDAYETRAEYREEVSVEKEPQKKAETFVKGLMDEETFAVSSDDSEDVISDNYYYMYMEKRYIKKIVSNPKDVEVYRKLGDLYVEMENYPDAKASFEQVLRLKPGDKHAILALKELEDHV